MPATRFLLITLAMASSELPAFPRVDIKVRAFVETTQQEVLLPQFVTDHVATNYNALSRRFNPSLFNTKILRKATKVRSLIKNKEILPSFITCVEHGITKVNKNLSVHWTFFNRNSDTLLIIGGGLANPRELLSPFAALFPNYDIVTFDYRGHGLEHKIASFRGWLSNKLFNFDASVSTLGQHEEEEILAMANHFNLIKQYKNRFGLGLCYSASLMTKTQAMYPDTFDKLLLDGSWASIKNLSDSFTKDPYLLLNPQRGSTLGRFMGRLPPLRSLFKLFGEWLFQTEFNRGLDVVQYFAKLTNTPVLFLHADNDLLIPNEQFERVWTAIPHKQKMALIIPGRHLQGFIKYKELYAFIGQLFFENTYQHAFRIISDKDWFDRDKGRLHYPG